MLAAGVIVALELVAWVGIALLGKDAFRTLLDFYDPRPYVGKVTSSARADGSVQRCSTFNGELFCIDDNSRKSDAPSQSDTAFEGQVAATNAQKNHHAVEKCATLNGELFCITEYQNIHIPDSSLAGDGHHSVDSADSLNLNPDSRERKKRCAYFDGESICIEEKI